MIRLNINHRYHIFPEADFGDLEVLEAVEKAAELCRDFDEIRGETLEEQLKDLYELGRKLMEVIDRVLGEGACRKMFGGRTNLVQLTEVFRQLQDGFHHTCLREDRKLEVRYEEL